MPDHYDDDPFNHHSTEDAAGKGNKKKKKKKKNIDTPDNIKFGDWSKEARENYLKLLDKEKNKK